MSYNRSCPKFDVSKSACGFRVGKTDCCVMEAGQIISYIAKEGSVGTLLFVGGSTSSLYVWLVTEIVPFSLDYDCGQK